MITLVTKVVIRVKIGNHRISGDICNHVNYGTKVTKTSVWALVILVTKANMITFVTKAVIRVAMSKHEVPLTYVRFATNMKYLDMLLAIP